MSQAASLPMSASAESTRQSSPAELDQAVAAVKAKAREFAKLGPNERKQLLLACLPTLLEVAEGWVRAGCEAKGIPFDGPLGGEEWLAGPMATVRNVRLLIESLTSIAQIGKPAFGRRVHHRSDGRIEVEVFPPSAKESVMFGGFSSRVLFQEGFDERKARESQASFYSKRDPEGGVSLILGAGNVSSIPPMDAFSKMFVDGNVCVIKMNPVNEWVGPFLERGLRPLIERDYLRIVYGGAEAGAYLCDHAEIDDIHITGSDRTHDLIVWGPPGEERERRIANKDPLLKKTITSELGNVSPIAIVPGDYSDEELDFIARNVATMVTNNASFNCNAGKMLITATGWSQREKLVSLIAKALASAPTRKAYYPGAHDRYETLVAGRDRVERIGEAKPHELPWTLIRDVDSSDPNEKLFRVEPFCAILSETSLGPNDPAAFLAEVTRFCNDVMWGTLNATIVIHPRTEADPQVKQALDRAVTDLRYGAVTINHWPGIVYGFVTPPWGGHPSATLDDIQSGLGFVHNTFMLEGIEKSVTRGPLVVKPKPAWFFDNKKTHLLGPKLVAFEANPSWFKVPGVALTALGG